VHHARPIRGQEHKEDLRFDFTLKGTVPDTKAFTLKHNKVMEPRQQERIKVFRVVGPRNKAPDENMSFLVASRRLQVQ
jgi:hypothetical protein